MKRCPKCNEIYYDQNQNFCLKDGETLQFSYDSQPTIVVDPASFTKSSSIPKQGVSPVFAYLSVGLLCLLIGGGVAALIFIYNKTDKNEIALQPQNTSSNTANLNINTAQNQPANVAVAPPTQAIPKPSRPLPKPIGSNRYIGSIANTETYFDLVWNENTKDVSGSFYYSANPNEVFTVAGRNVPEGNANLNILKAGQQIGEMKLVKVLSDTEICWQGYYSIGQKFVRLCRRRSK